MPLAPKYSDLQKISTSELQQEYDKLTNNTVIGLGFIHEEILRREQNKLTRELRILSWVVAIFALTQIIIAVVK